MAFLTALVYEEGEDTVWDFFIKVWPKMCEEARVYSLEQVIKFATVCDDGRKEYKSDSTVPRRILEEVFGDDKKWLILLNLPVHTKRQLSQ